MTLIQQIFAFWFFNFGVNGLRLLVPEDKQSNDNACIISKPPNYDYKQFADSSRYNLEAYGLMKQMPFGDHTGILSVMEKLSAGNDVSLAVLGGSETAGVNCHQQAQTDDLTGGVSFKECSWPRRLQRWLKDSFPKSFVKVSNLAQGGTTSSVILATVALLMTDEGFANADMIFLDTLVNDSQEAKAWSSTVGMKLSDGTTVSASYEQLVLSIHRLRPGVPIFSLLAGCPKCKIFKEHQKKITAHYKLPGLDISEVVEKVPVIWDRPEAHPSFRTHQAIADLIAISWVNVWENNSGCKVGEHNHKHKQFWPDSTFWDQETLNSFPYCSKAASSYTANDMHNSLTPHVLNGDWQLYEDRPGKPGWIGTKPESKITFPLSFGRHPRFILTWLRSYEQLGKARLTLNGRAYEIDGLWTNDFDEKVSQSYTMWFHADAAIFQPEAQESGLLGFGIAPDTTANVSFEILDTPGRNTNKFKLLSVLSC